MPAVLWSYRPWGLLKVIISKDIRTGRCPGRSETTDNAKRKIAKLKASIHKAGISPLSSQTSQALPSMSI